MRNLLLQPTTPSFMLKGSTALVLSLALSSSAVCESTVATNEMDVSVEVDDVKTAPKTGGFIEDALSKTAPKTGGFIEDALSKTASYEVLEGEEDIVHEPDPLEPFNRVIFEFNKIVDGILLKPAAIIFDITVHDSIHKGVRNIIDNAFAPISLINHTLQGEGEKAFRTFFRFLVNTTIGIAGIFDVATEMGLQKETTTTNETLTSWGVETGPYLVLPLLGPSSFRDATGHVGDYFMNPYVYLTQNAHRAHNHHRQQRIWLKALYALDALDTRREFLTALNELERLSPDYYVGLRSAYFQKQAGIKAKIENQKKN